MRHTYNKFYYRPTAQQLSNSLNFVTEFNLEKFNNFP